MKNNHIIYSAVTMLLLVTAVSGAILTSSGVRADSTAKASVKVSSACTMSGGGDYDMNVDPGTIRDITANNITITCNDAGGYALYAVGYSGESYDTNNTDLQAASPLTAASNIKTNTSGSDSYWAMKLSPVISSTPTIVSPYTDYAVIPASYTKVATYASTTLAGQQGSTVTPSYRIAISGGQPAGNYNGKVKYTMVHPATATAPGPQPAAKGKIVYHPNASDAVGTMANQSASNGGTVTLYASNFSREGYGFAGWNDKFDYSGTTYGPNETITAPSDVSTNGLSLYAVWVESAGNLQDWTTTDCNSLSQGGVTALTDERDGNTYAVAKLADNKCWMIENLRLENTAEHNSDGTLAQGYNSSFIGLADPESANFNSNGVANSLYSTDGSTTATISGNYTGYRFPRYNNFNTQSRGSSTTNSQNIYSYGNYYTWPAAIADTTYYNTGNQSIEGTSICPKGWRLPKGGNKSNEANNEFWNLVVTKLNSGTNPANYDSSTQPYFTGTEAEPVSKALRAYPNNFLYSGLFNGSSAYGRGSYGVYWSYTVYDINYSYYLGLGSSNVYPGTDYYSKYYGQSVRCLVGS